MSANIKQMERDRLQLLKELETGEAEMRQGPLTQSRGEELRQKAQQVEELDQHIRQYNEIAGIVKKGREIESPVLPGENGRKQSTVRTTPGALFVMSDAYKQYMAMGKQGWSGKVDIRDIRGRSVKLQGEEADRFRTKAYDPATLSTIGELIDPMTDPDVVRYEEPEILTIRDVLQVLPTNSDTVRFVRHTATERAAASQSPGRGGLKPYLTVEMDSESVSVETIAVLSKVTEQDIEDAPRLVGIINGEMRLDVKVEEERQLLWADGTNNQIEGLYSQGVEEQEFDDAAAGDTLIDTIRRMRARLRKRRFTPNAVLIDPMDWADIELTKGTDDHYIWGTVRTLNGPQLWSLRVVESDAAENPEDGARRVLMGDFLRGATLYDRHDVRLAVGYVDDDFARNLRTLRAEERVALAVKRPHAFLWAETNAAAVPAG